MTDGQLMSLARRLEAYLDKAHGLYMEIESSNHPNAAAIVDALGGNGIGPTWDVQLIVRDDLTTPEHWVPGPGGRYVFVR